ncbi:unnamed protein product [Closterium sp. Naga37s-1]|nr:unnamed protein product [Closterium sp. Naga37s-1]
MFRFVFRISAIRHQIDIGALPFDRAALYLLVTSGDVAVTINDETFCEDYCSKRSTLELHGADGSFAEAKFIHASDVAARCPDRCTFRGPRKTLPYACSNRPLPRSPVSVTCSEPNPLRHLLRHLGSSITEALPGPAAVPITASQFLERATFLPATVSEPSASDSPVEHEEGNSSADATTTAKTCATFPTETFIHAITFGSNSSDVLSVAQTGDMATCAATSVGAMVVPPTVAGRAK